VFRPSPRREAAVPCVPCVYLCGASLPLPHSIQRTEWKDDLSKPLPTDTEATEAETVGEGGEEVGALDHARVINAQALLTLQSCQVTTVANTLLYFLVFALFV